MFHPSLAKEYRQEFFFHCIGELLSSSCRNSEVIFTNGDGVTDPSFT